MMYNLISFSYGTYVHVSLKFYCTSRDVIVDLANAINNNWLFPTSRNRSSVSQIKSNTTLFKIAIPS